MNDPVPLRLYEDPGRPADAHPGAYRPARPDGWDHVVGEDIGVEDVRGGYIVGTITTIDPQIHTDPDGARYRIATVLLKD